jgi:hypothetical protein
VVAPSPSRLRALQQSHDSAKPVSTLIAKLRSPLLASRANLGFVVFCEQVIERLGDEVMHRAVELER